MIWPPNHPAPQSGNKAQHGVKPTGTHTHCTNTLNRLEWGLANCSPFLSFLLYPPPPFLPPPSRTSLPLFDIPMDGRPYCDWCTRKGATALLSPPLFPGLNIFGDRDRLMLIIDNILSFLIHVPQCISSLWWKGKLLLPFVRSPIKGKWREAVKVQEVDLMSCLRMHYRTSKT